MPRSTKGYKIFPVIIDVVINYVIYVLVHFARSEEIRKMVIEAILIKYGCPNVMTINQDDTFMSSLMSYLFKRLKIKDTWYL